MTLVAGNEQSISQHSDACQWHWSLESPTVQASGNVAVSAVDLAGNTSASVSAPFVLPKPTETPTIITYTDNVGTSTGDFGSGVVTDDTTPVLNGTLSAALASGEVVKVYDGATLMGNATVTGTTWTYAPSALAQHPRQRATKASPRNASIASTLPADQVAL